MQPNIADFAVSVIADPPTDPLNGTELTVTSAEGLLMPDVPFEAVIAPVNVLPTFNRVERVTVTEVDGDVLTITRGQGGTSAKPILVGYLLYNGIFAADILGAYNRANHIGTQLANTISDFAPAALAAIPDATLEVVGKVRQTVFNVKDYGAEGDGVTDDYDAIMDAIADADAAGGATVYFPPGCYVVSQALIYDKTASTTSIPAPSLVGAPGRSGPSPDFVSDRNFWYQSCVVTIRCSNSFPLGHYVVDWLGPIAQDRAICGYVMQGIVIDCNSRGAGMRNFNWFNGSVRDVLIDNHPQAPNPAYAGAYASPTSNTGAFMSSGKPTQNSFFNTIERVYVREAALDGFQFASGAGSFDLALNCLANNNGRFGYNVEDKTTLVECIAQTNARTKGLSGADFRVGRYDVSLIGCKAFSGKPYFGNGIKVAGGASSVAHVIGCTFYGAINEDQDMTEQDAAVVQLQGSLQNIEFVGCHFITGNGTFTSDFVYLSASATGRATFVACQFITEQGDPLTNVPVNANGNDNVLSFTNCHGLNPETTKTYATITNAQQSVQLGVTGGLPTGGTFTLTFGGQTTATIAYNASAATIQTALAALSSIGSGNVACSGGSVSSFPVIVTLQGTLGNATQSLLTSNGSGLTGGNVITITQLLPGGPNMTLDARNGSGQIIGMSGDIAPTITNGFVKGQEVTYKFIQGSPGGWTFTAPSNLKTRSGGFTLSTALNAVDYLVTRWDGSNWQEVSRGTDRALTISEGGTGATTASAARTALGLGTGSVLDSDTDTSLAANSDSRLPTQKAVKSYVDNTVTGLLDFKGSADASANPNYPVASKGDAYVVSVAGKVGGASGKSVDVGDVYVATADNAGGTEASVGTSWIVLEHNLQGALLAANNLSELASASTSRTNLGLGSIATQASSNIAITGGSVSSTRISPRVSTTASSSTPTPNADTDDEYTVTALAADATFGAPSGTPTEGQKLIFRIKDNGTARALAYNAIYRALGITLPATTIINKTLYLGLIYNATDTKWDVVAVSQEA